MHELRINRPDRQTEIDRFHVIILRYRKQKLVMKESQISNLIYLCEGNITTCDNSRAIHTALLQTQLFDGFNILHCESLRDVLEMYVQITQRIQDRYARASKITATPCKTYDEFCEACVQDKVSGSINSVNHIFGQMLMEIDRVGPTNVQGIISKYDTPQLFLSALKRTGVHKDPDACVGLISDIPVKKSYSHTETNFGNNDESRSLQSSRIGPAVERNIIEAISMTK